MNTKKLVLSALMVAMVSGSAAFAGPGGNGNGGGNENSRGARANDSNTNGVETSKLKWRNAGNASAEAFANANPESAVGLLATLKSATDAYNATEIDPDAIVRGVDEIQALLDDLDEPRDLDDILADMDVDGADLELLDAEMEAAVIYNALLAELELTEVIAAKDDAEAAVGLDDLTEPALDALWALLEGK